MTKIENSCNFLTSIEELAGLLYKDDLIIIDTREPEDYIVEHIPGAINIYDIFTYLSTNENGGYVAMQNYFAQIFGNAGIAGNERIVIYEDAMDNGYGRSCRGFFILLNLGCTNVSVLHGGFQAWNQKNLPVTKDIPLLTAKIFSVKINNSILVNSDEMLTSLNDDK